jgi:ubiquinone biosynthesis monooxygenase Coq7
MSNAADLAARLSPDLVVRCIIQVNHAGENGAIAIYRQQIAKAKARYPDLLPWLEETLGHEQTHRDRFLKLMPARGARPCPAMAVWSVGGWLLGRGTGLLGRQSVMVCTAAVERTVHAHLVQQIAYLQVHDPAVADTVREIQRDEDAHLAYAEARHDPGRPAARFLAALIAAITDFLILIATRGDSWRLARVLRSQ